MILPAVRRPAQPDPGPRAPGDTDRWALLVRPSANRVYDGAAPALLRAEVAVLSRHVLGGAVGEPALHELGGLPSVVLDAPADPDARAAALPHVARLSSAYALFGLGRAASCTRWPSPPPRRSTTTC